MGGTLYRGVPRISQPVLLSMCGLAWLDRIVACVVGVVSGLCCKDKRLLKGFLKFVQKHKVRNSLG